MIARGSKVIARGNNCVKQLVIAQGSKVVAQVITQGNSNCAR